MRLSIDSTKGVKEAWTACAACLNIFSSSFLSAVESTARMEFVFLLLLSSTQLVRAWALIDIDKLYIDKMYYYKLVHIFLTCYTHAYTAAPIK